MDDSLKAEHYIAFILLSQALASAFGDTTRSLGGRVHLVQNVQALRSFHHRDVTCGVCIFRTMEIAHVQLTVPSNRIRIRIQEFLYSGVAV